MNNSLKEFRCSKCGKLFFKGNLVECQIEIKCKNCKEFNKINGDEGVSLIDKNTHNCGVKKYIG